MDKDDQNIEHDGDQIVNGGFRHLKLTRILFTSTYERTIELISSCASPGSYGFNTNPMNPPSTVSRLVIFVCL